MKKVLLAILIITITYLSSGKTYAYDCTGLPDCHGNIVIGTGDIIQCNGHAYRCLVGGWCTQTTAGSPYEPGVGWAWQSAWEDLGACVDPLTTVPYTRFDGVVVQLVPYTGRNIALLIEPDPNKDPVIVQQIVDVLDNVYDFYKRTTGRTPVLFRQYNGLGTIAEVSQTCGAGCGYLGFTGIELLNGAMNTLYNGWSQRNEFDQILFYEFGRNFWFYEDKISPSGAVTTGYAVFMRVMGFEDTGVTMAPFYMQGQPYNLQQFEQAMQHVFELYLQDPTLNWANTFQIDRAPTNPYGLGAADLFSGMMLDLRDLYGNQFVENIWKEVDKRPSVTTNEAKADNFVVAASIAAGQNLATLFESWKWPVSQAAKDELANIFSGLIDCTFIPEWDPQIILVGGDWVKYQGKVYSAKWWTQGEPPNQNPWGVWEYIGDCIPGT